MTSPTWPLGCQEAPLGLPFNRREVEWALKDEGLMRDEMGEVENRWLLDEAGAVVQLSRKLH